MQTNGILQECDICLSQKAEANSEAVFKDNESTVAWAELAEECGLTRLLANAELFMVKHADPAFWHGPAFNTHKLNSSCMLRMLRAAQLNMSNWSSKFIPEAPRAQAKEWELSKCDCCKRMVWCARCSQSSYPKNRPTSIYPSLSALVSWQQTSRW